MARALLLGVCGILTALTAASAQTSTATPPRAGVGSARAATPGRIAVPALLPGTPESAFSTIQGNALDSLNGTLADGLVRLRDARLGRIVNTQLTDKSGLFEFRAVEPGSYVVELVGGAAGVLAASQLISVNAGEAVLAVVKLPFGLPPLGGLLGHTASQAATVTSAAAATGVLNAAATTEVSPDGTNIR